MRLSELRSAMSEYATRFDPARIPAHDAACVVEDAAAIKNMAATVEAWRRRASPRPRFGSATATGRLHTSWPARQEHP